MLTLEEYIAELRREAARKEFVATHDYNKGMADCTEGRYNKWYQTKREDEGRAYELGWLAQNIETKNTKAVYFKLPIFI